LPSTNVIVVGLPVVNYKKGHTRLAAAHDKVYQLLAHGRWFSPGTPASSTTKTGRHDITEILLKVALNTIKQTNKQTNIHILLSSVLSLTGLGKGDLLVQVTA
jgi:hypothetical protein